MSSEMTGSDRDFIIVRAAEGASVAQIQRELEERGLDVSWAVVNRIVEKYIQDVERVRRKMIDSGIGSYAVSSHRIMAKNNLAVSLYEIMDCVMQSAKDGDSNRLRDLKVVVDMWTNVVNSIQNDGGNIDYDNSLDDITDIVDGIESSSKDDIINQLKSSVDGDSDD